MQQRYDWESLKDWCLWYIDVFLECAKNGPEHMSYQVFESRVKERPINWKNIQRVSDRTVRDIVEAVTAVISETAATGQALPGDFEDARQLLIQYRKALQKESSPDVVANEFSIINK